MKRRRYSKQDLKTKFNNLTFFKKNLLVMAATLVLVCFTMVGYAALNETLNITGDLVLRANKDMRITDLSIVSATNNGYEKYNSKYSVDTITVITELSEVNSSVTYEATITNKGTVDMEITDINKSLSGNTSNLDCTISGLYVDDIIPAGATQTFTITLKRNAVTPTIQATEAGLVLELSWEEASIKYLAYKIEGNSIQNGTPSPSNPVEIQSVGDKSVNLFDPTLNFVPTTINGITVEYLEDEDVYVLNGTATSTNRVAYRFINIPIVKGSYFSLSTEYVSGTVTRPNGNEYAVAYFGAADAVNTSNNWATVNLRENDETKLNQQCNYDYITQFWFYVSAGVTFDNYKVKIQLQEGSKATEYEPYGKYKIELEYGNNNLLDIAKLTDMTTNGTLVNNEDGTFDLVYSSNGRFTENMDLYIPANTTFTISYEMLGYTGTHGYGFNVQYTLADGTKQYSNFNVNTDTKKITHTFASDVVKIGLYQQSSNSVGTYTRFKNLQIELGNTATRYMPYVEPITASIYLDEPLRKAGSTADYIDFRTGILRRNIGAQTFDGTESWSAYSQTNSYMISASGTANNDNILSNYFLPLNNTPGYLSTNARFTNRYNNFYFKNDNTTTLEAWKTWLVDIYSNNTPLIVNYQLASPIDTAIKLPEIIKQPYYTTVKVKTSIQPSNFTYQFVKK